MCDRWREENTGRKGAEKRVKALRFALIEAPDPTAALAAVQALAAFVGASEFVVLGSQGVESLRAILSAT